MSTDNTPTSPPPPPPSGKRRRGFAAMPKEQVQAIAQKGGRAAHEQGAAHEFTPEEAKVAGSKGGKAAHARRVGAHRNSP